MDDQNKTPGPTPSVDPIRPPVPTASPENQAAPGPIVTPPPVNPLATPPATTDAPQTQPNQINTPGYQAQAAPSNDQELATMLGTANVPRPGEEPLPADPGTLQKAGAGFLAILGGIFSWVIFPLGVVLVLHFFVFQAYHVLGTSMHPTLQQSDYLIISKIGYTQAKVAQIFNKDKVYIPARGEIIVFHYPKDPSETFVKRVIGVPGDRIVIKSGTVTLYTPEHKEGINPDLGYEADGTQTTIDTDETVEPGNVFVMGDNRTPGGSYDSREWGQLPSSYIIGNAVLRLLPLDTVKVL